MLRRKDLEDTSETRKQDRMVSNQMVFQEGSTVCRVSEKGVEKTGACGCGVFLSPGTLGLYDAVFFIWLYMEFLLMCTVLTV